MAVALVLVTALSAACGSTSSEHEPTSTSAASSTPEKSSAESTRTEAEAAATYLQIKIDEIPAAPTIDNLTFVDPLHGWATNRCEDFAEDLQLCDILATTDGGKTWRVQHREFGPLGQPRFFDTRQGVIVNGPESILRTVDSGVTWTSDYFSALQDLDHIQMVSVDTGFALGSGVVFRLESETGAWTFNFGSGDCSFESLTSTPDGAVWAGGRSAAGPCLYKTDDLGNTWSVSVAGVESSRVASALQQSSLFRAADNPFYGIMVQTCAAAPSFFGAEGRLVIRCDTGEGVTLTTSDAGGSWQYQSRQTACLNACNTRKYETGFSDQTFFLDLEHAWRRTAHQEVSWTADGGNTWTAVSGPELCCDADNIFFVDADHGWITFGDSLAVTTDGGRAWERVPVTIVQ